MAFNLTPSANKGKLKMESFLSDDMVVETEHKKIDISKLVLWDNQPFRMYSDNRLDALVNSIKENGVIDPIIVRPIGDDKFQILAGRHRVKACKILGMTEIPHIVANVDENHAKLILVDTNLCQRMELLPSERAFAYKMQCEALVALGKGKSTAEVAQRYGESSRTIQRYLACTRLCSSLMEMLDNGKLILRAAVPLAGMDEQNQCVVGNYLAENEEIRLTEQQAQEIFKISFRHPLCFEDIEDVLYIHDSAPPAQKSNTAVENSEREDDTPTEQEEIAEDTVTIEPKPNQTDDISETPPKPAAPKTTSSSNISLARSEVTEIIGEDYSNDDILDFIIFCLQHEEWLKEWQEFERSADEEVDRQA